MTSIIIHHRPPRTHERPHRLLRANHTAILGLIPEKVDVGCVELSYSDLSEKEEDEEKGLLSFIR